MQLRDYQEKAVMDIRNAFRDNDKIVFQLPTGGGKSLIFATICNMFLQKSDAGSVLVCVHRDELRKQFMATMHRVYGILPYPIIAGKPTAPARLYIAMVETLFRRLSNQRFKPQNVKLVIIDECHFGSFNKILDAFPNAKILGVTATPIMAKGKNKTHISDIYQDLVCGPQISEMVLKGHLCPNITRNISKNIDRSKLGTKMGDFDEKDLFDAFRKKRQLNNTITAYERFLKGKKTMVFNVNVEHSKLVNEAFITGGYNSKHLDGNISEAERNAILKWFKDTPGAIINSIGILTTGFDEPSVEGIIINRATKSLPLFLQICGRGSRTFPNKEDFQIVDMGANALYFGDWSDDRDWNRIFFDKDRKPTNGVAPVKDCPACMAIVHASATTCKYCGFVFPIKPIQYDDSKIEFETKAIIGRTIKLKEIVSKARSFGWQDSAIPYELARWVAWSAIKVKGVDHSDQNRILHFNNEYISLLEKINSDYNIEIKEYHKKLFLKEINKRFNLTGTIS